MWFTTVHSKLLAAIIANQDLRGEMAVLSSASVTWAVQTTNETTTFFRAYETA
jgi:hypothetical protein